MYTWYVHPNLSIIYSEPARFTITEMASARQRIITLYDNHTTLLSKHDSVIEAMQYANSDALREGVS